MRPRVFVSSVMDQFGEYREAMRAAIIAAGGEPVLIEDFGGLPKSPRNACLDAVCSCDIYAGIIGSRGGSIAPSGKLVVEEEFDEAKRCKLTTLVFVEQCTRDISAQGLIKTVSNYVEGLFRPTFRGSVELQQIAEQTLKPLIEARGRGKMDVLSIERYLNKGDLRCSEPTLRFVLSPAYKNELIDPVALESEELRIELIEIGNSKNVRLFSSQEAKDIVLENDSIVIQQVHGRWAGYTVRLEITGHGIICIDVRIAKACNDTHQMMRSMVLVEEDLADVISKCFAFVSAFYQSKDPYKRYDLMNYEIMLLGVGYRKLVKTPPTGNSVSMSMRGDEPVKVFDFPQPLVRQDLLAPAKEIELALALCRRRLRD